MQMCDYLSCVGVACSLFLVVNYIHLPFAGFVLHVSVCVCVSCDCVVCWCVGVFAQVCVIVMCGLFDCMVVCVVVGVIVVFVDWRVCF